MTNLEKEMEMHEHDWLAERFEANRPHLRAVAFRMLGSPSEAEDAVQESWLRLSRSDTSAVKNLTGWLTTVVARVCLDMLRARTSRREEPVGVLLPDSLGGTTDEDPEHEALLADSIGLALLVVLETLAPAERVAFVLHDTFGVPFDEVAPIVGRSSTAARQLASRARRRVQGSASVPDADHTSHRHIVEAFLAASRRGDFQALLELLDPEVVLRADAATVCMGATKEMRGKQAVAERFSGHAKAARLALVNGKPAAVWSERGRPKVVFGFTIKDGKIGAIGMVSDPEILQRLDVVLPNA
jgi:RNA polymerase sigma-70 factor (ECF subfamily)